VEVAERRATVIRLLRERGALVRGLDLNGNGDDITALDVADMAAVTDAIDTIAARDGLDILVNCAGTGRLHTIYDVTLQDWQAVLDVNLGGTFAACRAASAHMVRAGRGAIINIGSTFGLLARENGLAYGVSKAAVIHLTRQMAVDLTDSGVRVNCVCPGLVETGMTSVMYTEEWAATLRANNALHAMRRSGAPQEIAEAVVFLASDAASFITGAALPVDGGYTAGKWVTPPLGA